MYEKKREKKNSINEEYDSNITNIKSNLIVIKLSSKYLLFLRFLFQLK